MFRAAVDFGVGFVVPEGALAKVVVDAPAGFGGEYSGGVLRIADRALPNAPEFTMRLAVAEPDGRHIVSLPLSGRTRSVGERGLIADLKDAAELMSVEIRVDAANSKFTFHYTFSPRPCTPSVALVHFGDSGHPFRLKADSVSGESGQLLPVTCVGGGALVRCSVMWSGDVDAPPGHKRSQTGPCVFSRFCVIFASRPAAGRF